MNAVIMHCLINTGTAAAVGGGVREKHVFLRALTIRSNNRAGSEGEGSFICVL